MSISNPTSKPTSKPTTTQTSTPTAPITEWHTSVTVCNWNSI